MLPLVRKGCQTLEGTLAKQAEEIRKKAKGRTCGSCKFGRFPDGECSKHGWWPDDSRNISISPEAVACGQFEPNVLMITDLSPEVQFSDCLEISWHNGVLYTCTLRDRHPGICQMISEEGQWLLPL